MVFSEKKYETLERFQEKYQLAQDDVRYVVDNKHLKISIRLRSLYYVEKLTCKNREPLKGKDEGFLEGFVGIYPEDVWTILKEGCTELKRFTSMEQDGPIFRLADKLPQQPIIANREDLVVLKEHEEEFKNTLKINESTFKTRNSEPIIFEVSGDYLEVIMRGREFLLGDIQGKIIKQLHEAYLQDKPWVSGKTLTHEAGSENEKLHAIFSNEFVREALIRSNGNGRYRLNLPLSYRNQLLEAKLKKSHPNSD